jgi:PAS domain S-box-containing protein
MTPATIRSVETAVLDAIRDPIALVDEGWRILYLNPAATAFFATNASNALGHTLWHIWSDLPDELAAQLRAIGTEPVSLMFHRPPPSASRLVEVSPSPRGRLLHFRDIGSQMQLQAKLMTEADVAYREQQERTLFREITAREQAEAASTEILRILERIGDAYIAFDTEWRYTYVNQKAAELARKPASELLGRSVWDEFPEAVHTAFFTELHRSMQQQIPVEFENCYAPLGKWFDNRVYPSPSGAAVFYRDITERKRTQQALERTAAELATKNAELEAFAYVVSHDLQEPLRAIATFTSLLAKRYGDALDADAQGYIRYILEGSERLQRLIRDLLALALIGRPAQRSKVSAAKALQVARSNLSAAIAESGAILECGELPEVLANEVHLCQLFQNLIGNAIKYRREEPLRITVAAERQSGCWRFSVQDNGRGFDMAYAEQVFMPFKRLQGSTDSGSGIGLSVCKKIVENCGGRIWVESVAGCGSTFYFTIPDETPPAA